MVPACHGVPAAYLTEAGMQMVGGYLGTLNCLANCKVSSAQGDLGFETVCHF